MNRACSRQTGKSFTKSLRRILRGLARRRTQVFLSAGERQCRELMNKAREHCRALKIACDYYDQRFFKGLSIKQLEIVLPGGGPVPLARGAKSSAVVMLRPPGGCTREARPLVAGSSDYRRTRRPRGFTGDVLLDEFAMHAFDREIWAAVLPMLLRA